MARVSDMLADRLKRRFEKSRAIKASIEQEYNSAHLSPDHQGKIAFIRTDLDYFPEREQGFLIQHGYECLSNGLKNEFGIKYEPASAPNFITKRTSKEKELKFLDRSAKRKLRLFSFKDIVSYLSLLVIFLIAGSIGYFWFDLRERADVAERNLKQEQNETENQERLKNAEKLKDPIINPTDEAEYISDFTDYVRAQGILQLDPMQLLVLGNANDDQKSPARDKNNLPPKELWENIIPVARVFEEFQEVSGYNVKVISAFRSKEYNRLTSGARSSRHLSFDAVDFSANVGDSAEWARILREIRSTGAFKGGIGVNDKFIHLDTRGINADWDARPRESASLDPNVITNPDQIKRSDFTVYLQFAGYKRSTMIDLAKALTDDGWLVPGLEHGGERTGLAAGLSEIRYSGENEEAAKALATQVGLAGIKGEINPLLVSAIDKNVLEIWIGLR